MLKKLRRKFIAIAMLWVSIVIITIVGTINIANYISTNEALESTNKGTPTLKEPPSGRTDVQPPEDMNL